MQQITRVVCWIKKRCFCAVRTFFMMGVAVGISVPWVAQALPVGYSATVAPSPNSTYWSPELKVTLDNGMPPSNDSVSRNLGPGECSYMGWLATRICARITLPIGPRYPGDKGYDSDNPDNNKAKKNYGNNTGPEGNPRVQLCAYVDPCDGGDPPDGSCTINSHSPFHHNTPRENVLNNKDLIILGAVSGAVLVGTAGLGVVAVAPAIAFAYMIKAIMKNYNHVVMDNLGCVDISLAPLPPAWVHNAWTLQYAPNPNVEIGTNVDARTLRVTGGVSFFDPITAVKICRDKRVSSSVVLLSCGDPNSILQETLLLDPNVANKKEVLGSSPTEYVYEDCKESTVALEDGSKRTYCARIMTAKPDKVCVFKKGDASTNFKDIMIKCIDRPGWMPKPLLFLEPDSVTSGKYQVQLKYPGYDSESLVLREDPAVKNNTPYSQLNPSWTANCGYLQQVEFCLKRPCKTEVFQTTPSGEQTPASCSEYESSYCVHGFDAPYGVAVTTKSGAVIAGYPNIRQPAYKGWVYNPAQCFQKDFATGKCINYAGKPNGGVCCDAQLDNCLGVPAPFTNSDGACIQYVRNTTNDEFWIDSSSIFAPTSDAQSKCAMDRSYMDPQNTGTNVDCRPKVSIRPLEPREAGMCIGLPESEGILLKNGPYAGVYTVPPGCNRIQVRLWGGGGVGHSQDNGDAWDHSGGSGAYAMWELGVSEREQIQVNVGQGAQTEGGGANGRNSTISHWFGSTQQIFTVPGGGGSTDGEKCPYATTAGKYKGGQLDKRSWRWNSDACTTDSAQKSMASCYIYPETRDGIDGVCNGHSSRGPGGGQIPGGLGPTACIRGSTATLMFSELSPIPGEDSSWDDKTWPFRWPGAGGCTFDDHYDGKGDYPGSNGRVEIRCIISGLVGGQNKCLANPHYRYHTRLADPIMKRQRFFDCNLPETLHGERAPTEACVEDRSPAPVIAQYERVNADPPICQNGVWD